MAELRDLSPPWKRCRSNSPTSAMKALKFAALTINEGKLRLPQTRIACVLRLALLDVCAKESLSSEQLQFVVLARQEAFPENTAFFDAEMRVLGFPHKIAEVVHVQDTQLVVHARDPDVGKMTHELILESQPGVEKKGSARSKGIAAAVLDFGGIVACFGSVHLDGNFVDPVRLGPPPRLMEEASRLTEGRIDCIVILGDINSTMLGRETVADAEVMSASSSLTSQLADASRSSSEQATFPLSDDLKEDLYRALSKPELRMQLSIMDGCPAEIRAEVEAISALRLIPCSPSSFPTYRLCTPDASALAHLQEINACTEDDGCFALHSGLQVEPETIKTMYFGGTHGRSGAIKKRGEMCRVGMGWLDRMYVGTRDGASVDAEQGTPYFLLAENREALDHMLIPWLVSVSR